MLVQSVDGLYEGSRTKVRVGSGTSDEFGVRVGVRRGSVLSPSVSDTGYGIRQYPALFKVSGIRPIVLLHSVGYS